MVATERNKRFALDTNILIDLAAEVDSAHTFIEVFLGKSIQLVVPPTVVQELFFFARGHDPKRDLGLKALQCMREWKLSVLDLVPVGHGITEQFARRLMVRRLLPAGEWNDGQILAEASLIGATMLVTSDSHLLDIDEASLVSAFNDSDLRPVQVFHPKNLLRAVR